MFYDGRDGKKLAVKPTECLTMLPTIYNADTLGIRPDLVGGRDKITSWTDLLDPEFKGKAALQDQPRSVSSMSPWHWNRAATSNTATRAT